MTQELANASPSDRGLEEDLSRFAEGKGVTSTSKDLECLC